MTQKVFTDRTRIIQAQRCQRSRYLGYHAEGLGLVSAKTPLPLGVGSAVHAGLACLLLGQDEDAAVGAALVELSTYRDGGLELDAGEQAAQGVATAIVTTPDDLMRAQLAASLGMTVEDAGLDALMTTSRNGRATFDAYLWEEQSALVEGMVRAYARRRLKPLLEEFEVLEVEREGSWRLSDVVLGRDGDGPAYVLSPELWFMSRPDALLRSCADNSLYILSFKTAAQWDVRKAKDAEHDMQGLSEGVEVERRLADWWLQLQGDGPIDPIEGRSQAMVDYLAALPAPPRILGIRMEFLLKGTRWKDKDLSARVGFDAWSQRSHLVRYYECHSVPKTTKAGAVPAFAHGDRCWAWDYLKDDGTESHLAWQNWRSKPAWELPGGVRQWIDALDDAEMTLSAYDSTIGMEPREIGWRSRAQQLGYTAQHPLDACFIPPMTLYRNSDELLDWVEQTEYAERRIAEGVAAVAAATDDGERRSRLNQHFPMSRHSCEYPSTCAFTKLCYGGEDIRAQPLNSGLYKLRVPNHPIEGQQPNKEEVSRG